MADLSVTCGLHQTDSEAAQQGGARQDRRPGDEATQLDPGTASYRHARAGCRARGLGDDPPSLPRHHCDFRLRRPGALAPVALRLRPSPLPVLYGAEIQQRLRTKLY
jgi:hypothetical protein